MAGDLNGNGLRANQTGISVYQELMDCITCAPFAHRAHGDPSSVFKPINRLASCAVRGIRVLNPGSYSVVNVAGSAVVRLTTGTYFVDRLSVTPTARLEFDTIGGPITLNVGSFLEHQGQTDVAGTEGRIWSRTSERTRWSSRAGSAAPSWRHGPT